MAAPRRRSARKTLAGNEPQVCSTTLPAQSPRRFERSCANVLRAESAVVNRNTRAASHASARSSTGSPQPINPTPRRAAASRRATTKRTGSPAWASSFPIAWPMRPGPTIAIPEFAGHKWPRVFNLSPSPDVAPASGRHLVDFQAIPLACTSSGYSSRKRFPTRKRRKLSGRARDLSGKSDMAFGQDCQALATAVPVKGTS
jgi:hypothetical protein